MSELDVNAPEVQELIKQQLEKVQQEYEAKLSAVAGKKDEILAEKKKLQESLKQFEGTDVSALLEMKKRLEADEEGKLIAEGKLEEVWNKRTERLQRDLNSKIEALSSELEKEKSEKARLSEQKKRYTIDSMVRDEALKAGVRPDAMDYVLRLARDVYDEDETGSIVPRDAYGDIILGKDAKNPQPISEWVSELREKAEFVFPPSAGSGASGSGKGGKGQMTAEYLNSLSAEDYAKLRKEGKIK